MTCPLHSLTDGSLRAVAASLRSGVLAAGMSRTEIQRTCGSASVAVCEYFNTLYSDGLSPKHILAIRSQDLCRVAGSRISSTCLALSPYESLRKGANSVLPATDRAIGNLQQWLIGTYHGVSRDQLQVYLD